MPFRVSDAPVTATSDVFYLHGFASSAHSTKGAYLAARLAAHGLALRCPDFNQPDFTTLTMTRMLEQVEQELLAIRPRPAALVGSSLGGALAVLAAERWPALIDRLVLLAPAVMFARPGHHLLPPERVTEWRQRGALPFFHYGYGEERLLNVAFYEDSLRYDPFATRFSQPTLIFQGLGDRSVDPATVDEFARAHPNVTLSLLDDDHQLVASLPRIWSGMQPFLGLTA
jgi:pimeloyl-ACP methyl ester carboxylesterase